MQTSFSLMEDFIGTVKSYDRTTREVQVFIPKLMPSVAEGREDITTRTNLGNSSISVKYNENITIASNVRAFSIDADEGMPVVGSHVFLKFLDGKTDKLFWIKFNKNEDFEVIDEEKYSKVYTLSIGNEEFDIYEEDKVNITLPENFYLVYTESSDGKTKNINLTFEDPISKKVTLLETTIGAKSSTRTYDDGGEIKVVETLPSGLAGDVEALEAKIQELEERLLELEGSSSTET